ncbi:lipid IV(A) 3-deoxy-D-manno-octulosonic acid transferase [Campylobacter sp. faydin G-140]|uniref:lipid IV(A) 3-deoxy-D-manno-octulosonic acid transferase n=1 Tax=Campylobacter anatolicus TaxID=2829105 RepID=UPI001B96CC62|nr:lipid IV(A) 3-deoxy-D-manno-octulosonic acid transferase [Campylobacter anatolicus]MBR8464825.1 lipid IV(A) 3-deoxy-D-manno-octulosonic acid transferase [Campylobacter anatolicus]
MVFVYYVLALIAWLLGAIVLICVSFKQKYHRSIPARFFLYKNLYYKAAKVHFHAASFGEIQALSPILQMFDDKFISVITATGYKAAKQISQNVAFLPFEIFLPFWLKKSKILVIFEAELWLMLVFMAKLRGTRVILVNARISDRSFNKYQKFTFFYKSIFKFIDKIYAQSQADKERLIRLGARDIVVCGNIKSAFLPSVNKIYAKPKERLITFASTHAGEEKLLLDEFKFRPNDKLIIAPRHPERFCDVEILACEWADKNGLKFNKISCDSELNAQVILLDTLGELVNIYAISDIVVLGGSFVPNVGGHNPIECASFGAMIVSGKHIFNQKVLYSLVSGIKLIEANELDIAINEEFIRSNIIKKADANMIINDIRMAYESRESI